MIAPLILTEMLLNAYSLRQTCKPVSCVILILLRETCLCLDMLVFTMLYTLTNAKYSIELTQGELELLQIGWIPAHLIAQLLL